MSEVVTLYVEADVAGSDDEELDAFASLLRRELAALDVDVERPTAGRAPEGARGFELAAIGALLVTLDKNRERLGAIIGTVRRLVGGDRTVKMTIDGDTIEVGPGVSMEDQRRLIDLWLERHAPA